MPTDSSKYFIRTTLQKLACLRDACASVSEPRSSKLIATGNEKKEFVAARDAKSKHKLLGNDASGAKISWKDLPRVHQLCFAIKRSSHFN